MVPREPHLGSISTFNYLKDIMFNSSTHFLKKKKQRELQPTYNLQPATFWKADREEDNLCSTLLSIYQRHSRMEKTLLRQKLLQKARCLFGHLFPNNIAHTRIPSVSEP